MLDYRVRTFLCMGNFSIVGRHVGTLLLYHKLNPSVTSRFPIMDYVISNYGMQHIPDQIFNYLSLQELNNCRLVSKQWQNYLLESRFFWIKHLETMQYVKIGLHSEFRKYQAGLFKCRMAFGVSFPFYDLPIKLMKLQSTEIIKIFAQNMRYYFESEKKSLEVLSPMQWSMFQDIKSGFSWDYIRTKIITQQISDFNAVDDSGWILLRRAIRDKLPQTVEVILQHAEELGIDTNALEHNGLTPLGFAVHHGTPEILDTFLNYTVNKGLELNTVNGFHGLTSLQYICSNGQYSKLEVMLKYASYGLNVNAEDGYGNTALHMACLNNCIDVVEVLLTCAQRIGLNVGAKNLDHQTAFSIACRCGLWDLIRMFSVMEAIDISANGNDVNDFSFAKLVPKIDYGTLAEYQAIHQSQIQARYNGSVNPRTVDELYFAK